MQPRSILFHNGFVHSASDPFATAIYIEDGVVAWLGDEDSSASFAKRAERVVDLKGALVAPAFVDTHVHLLETALSELAADVSPEQGGTSCALVLDLISSHIQEHGSEALGRTVCTTGYDDSGWSTASLTRKDLDDAFPERAIYVPRTDLHSAVCSSPLLEAAGLTASAVSNGRVAGADHTRVRAYVRALEDAERKALYIGTLQQAAALGFVALHENSAPGVDTREGLAGLLALTASPASGLPLVVGYRGELVSDVSEVDELRAIVPGLKGLAGDLSIDGSFGSRSAALRAPYSDDLTNSGTLHLPVPQVRDHLRACSNAGFTAGFHLIGDRALDVLLEAARELAQEPNMLSAMRRCGHRLEHVELADHTSIEELASLGFMVSVQPAFDAAWGTPDGMYQIRLGKERASQTTPIASFMKAGVPVGFGSDSPVTKLDPWGSIAAAVFHNNRAQRISARAAFKAHTRGGWRLGGEQNPMVGELRIGAPAHVSVWLATQLGVQAENDGRSLWSTDSRAGSPLLPVLDPAAIAAGERPRCLATMREGRFLFDDLERV